MKPVTIIRSPEKYTLLLPDLSEAILMALRDIAEARGFEKLAEDAHLSPKSLYKILSESKDAKPRFDTIVKLLDALGLRLTVEEKQKAS